MRILNIILLILILQNSVIAQDPVFSQYYNSPVYLNPALVGDEDNMTINMTYRSQWNSLNFPYKTAQISAIIPYYESVHTKPEGHKGGIGISLFNDISGAYDNFKTTGGNISLSYNLPLDERYSHQVNFGLQAGLINKRVDTENLQWGEQYQRFIGFNQSITPAEISQFEAKTFFDFTPGVFYRYTNRKGLGAIRTAFSGITVAHLNHPDESVLANSADRLPLIYKYHGGMVFSLGGRASFSANLLTLVQDRENQTNVGGFLNYEIMNPSIMTNAIVRVGSWYRRNDAFILSTEFLTNKYHFAFSYDWNVSSLRYQNRGTGAYEFTFGLRFYDDRPPKVRY